MCWTSPNCARNFYGCSTRVGDRTGQLPACVTLDTHFVLLAVGATTIPLGLCSAPDKLDICHLPRTVGVLYGLLNLTKSARVPLHALPAYRTGCDEGPRLSCGLRHFSQRRVQWPPGYIVDDFGLSVNLMPACTAHILVGDVGTWHNAIKNQHELHKSTRSPWKLMREA